MNIVIEVLYFRVINAKKQNNKLIGYIQISSIIYKRFELMHVINNEPSYKRLMQFLCFIMKPFILNFNKLVHSIVIYNWVFVQFVSLCNVANRPFKRTVCSYLHRKYHIVRTQNHLMLVLLYTLYKDKLLLEIALFNFKCK